MLLYKYILIYKSIYVIFLNSVSVNIIVEYFESIIIGNVFLKLKSLKTEFDISYAV